MFDSGRFLVLLSLIMFGIYIFAMSSNEISSGGSGTAFIGYNVAVALFGTFVGDTKRPSAALQYLIILALSLIADLVWLIMFGKDMAQGNTGQKFGLGMSIIGLLLKVPAFFFSFVLFRNGGSSSASASEGGYSKHDGGDRVGDSYQGSVDA